MRVALLCGLPAALLAGFAGAGATPPSPAPATVTVTARGETEPVGTAAADAADDPAIWRNRRNPAASLIVGTDKKAGLHVYGLDGRSRHFLPDGRLNNVDLVDMGRAGVIVVASDRNDEAAARLRLYRLDIGAARLVPLGTVPGGRARLMACA
ncbi:phytase [Sphingomonas changnyeongensis]|uniref:phytase n=1 Tax=Sphingomonas changnyeongensis TaxID=2698679 RepID=UPI002285FE46|nr:phytase [Sphingomonas changnyeongensis]